MHKSTASSKNKIRTYCSECPVNKGNNNYIVISSNKETNSNKTTIIKFATMNVHSLKHHESLIELEVAFNEKKNRYPRIDRGT